MDKKRSPKYLVIKRQICPECEGSGITIHPAWSLYWKEIDVNTGLRMTEQETALWFREHGEDRIPPRRSRMPGMWWQRMD